MQNFGAASQLKERQLFSTISILPARFPRITNLLSRRLPDYQDSRKTYPLTDLGSDLPLGSMAFVTSARKSPLYSFSIRLGITKNVLSNNLFRLKNVVYTAVPRDAREEWGRGIPPWRVKIHREMEVTRVKDGTATAGQGEVSRPDRKDDSLKSDAVIILQPDTPAPEECLIDGNDIQALLRLLDDVLNLSDEASRSEKLLNGLCELIGADSWQRLASAAGPSISEMYEKFRKEGPGVHGGIAICILNQSGPVFVLLRHLHPFTPRELRLASVLLTEVRWLCTAPSPEAPIPQVRLSLREKQVCTLLLAGLDRYGIADHLGVAINTVSGYVRSAYKKLGVHSQVELLTRFNQTSSVIGNPSSLSSLP